MAAATAGAIVGGSSVVPNGVGGPVAFITVSAPSGSETCTGTLISPTVVMTAAHCVFETSRSGNLLGIARPSEISVRVGSQDVSNPTLGEDAGVIAVLPQPRYRWDGTRQLHDVALLALDRTMTHAPATLAEQRPSTGSPLLIAGYGRTSMGDTTPPGVLRVALIDADSPASCRLVSKTFDPYWLFCGATSPDATMPGGTACYGDSGGPAFAAGSTDANIVVEGVISYGSRIDCAFSRTYLVLVASERGFIDRTLATPPEQWAHLRDDPPTVTIKPVDLRVGQAGVVHLRVNDDKSRHARILIGFYTHDGTQLSHAYRGVTTNHWVQFRLLRQLQRFSGYVCAQGIDGTDKRSNLLCAPDTIR